jgi:hypothetical protein
LVAPRTMTPSVPLNPSISVRIWLRVCSRSSLAPNEDPPVRDGSGRGDEPDPHGGGRVSLVAHDPNVWVIASTLARGRVKVSLVR